MADITLFQLLSCLEAALDQLKLGDRVHEGPGELRALVGILQSGPGKRLVRQPSGYYAHASFQCT